MDIASHGASIYQQLEDQARSRRPEIMKTLAQWREAAEANG